MYYMFARKPWHEDVSVDSVDVVKGKIDEMSFCGGGRRIGRR